MILLNADQSALPVKNFEIVKLGKYDVYNLFIYFISV